MCERERERGRERVRGRESTIDNGERPLFHRLGWPDLEGCGDLLDQENPQGFLRQGGQSLGEFLHPQQTGSFRVQPRLDVFCQCIPKSCFGILLQPLNNQSV